ncbi:hypothetical protein ID866_1731 [Astraeus odoratus]|nr:hypothetical protein ID866_1731 [Astraeus odoratus]
MLFRSDFIRKRTIPRDVEKRQQNLSRIAGQCWKLMSAEDKAIWHEKSAALTAAHYAKYPDYKFRPTRKSTVKRGGKGTDKQSHSCDYRGDNESLTRTRSETVEPCVGPVRSARSRARKSPCDEGTLSQLRGSITSPSSASLSLSPLSLTSELPPPASQDQIPTAGPSNDTQLSAFVDPVQRLLRLDPNPSDKSLGCSLGVTFSDAVQDLNIVRDFPILPPVRGPNFLKTPNEFRVLSQRCQTTQVVCFCGEQHPIPPALYHSYTPLLSSSTVTPSVYRGVNIDLIHSSGVPDGTFGYPYDGLQPYFGTLFSWL